nr:MAG TPA: hypothetical protein [Caudoviricetes sp.]
MEIYVNMYLKIFSYLIFKFYTFPLQTVGGFLFRC